MEASAPTIIGSFYYNVNTGESGTAASGAFRYSNINDGQAANGDNTSTPIYTFDASRCSSIYGTSSTIRPVSKQVRFMIRF